MSSYAYYLGWYLWKLAFWSPYLYTQRWGWDFWDDKAYERLVMHNRRHQLDND